MTYSANRLIDLTRNEPDWTLAFSAGPASPEEDLEPYVGRCLILDLSASTNRSILKDELENAFVGLTPHYEARLRGLSLGETLPPRLLFKTAGYSGSWRYLSESALEFLVSKGIRLIGLDSSTVSDPQATVGVMEQKVLQCGISVLINLNMNDLGAAAQGILMAAPLVIGQGPGRPVRAVLLSQ
ncbi:MAG: hypothetical protein KC777_00100 [Cyanobacteria bacterium HKST-UBA02]|nr:hypothetical protein [Cyanobacteria bacterium HKST-UBA02]